MLAVPIDFTILEKSTLQLIWLLDFKDNDAERHSTYSAFLTERTNTDIELPQKGKIALQHPPSALLDLGCTHETKSKITIIHSSTISLWNTGVSL